MAAALDDDLDPVLQLFALVMEQTGEQPGISVLVGGRWLTGDLVSPRMWMHETAEFISERAGPGGDGLRAFFAQAGSMLFPSDSELEARGEEVVEPAAPRHLHLRNARLLHDSGPIPGPPGGYVRVRLSEVEAWLLGSLDFG